MADYHTVNEDDGSMLISISRETNHHGNNAGIENKSSEPDENEIMRRKDRKHADNIIRKYEVRHRISTNAEQYRMHVNRYFFPCKGFRHVRQ